MASRYDARMLEIATQRAAQADSTGQNRIEDSTQTVTRGMANPLVWLFCIGGIVLIPLTGGLSIGLLIVALLIATGGGRACAQAIAPTTADLAAPGPGCVRVVAALGSLILLLIIIGLFLAAVAYNAGVKP